MRPGPGQLQPQFGPPRQALDSPNQNKAAGLKWIQFLSTGRELVASRGQPPNKQASIAVHLLCINFRLWQCKVWYWRKLNENSPYFIYMSSSYFCIVHTWEQWFGYIFYGYIHCFIVHSILQNKRNASMLWIVPKHEVAFIVIKFHFMVLFYDHGLWQITISPADVSVFEAKSRMD